MLYQNWVYQTPAPPPFSPRDYHFSDSTFYWSKDCKVLLFRTPIRTLILWRNSGGNWNSQLSTLRSVDRLFSFKSLRISLVIWLVKQFLGLYFSPFLNRKPGGSRVLSLPLTCLGVDGLFSFRSAFREPGVTWLVSGKSRKEYLLFRFWASSNRIAFSRS